MRVISNTAISLDGRIATAAYDHVAIGTETDRRYMSVLRARSDAVLVGGLTFRNWPLPLVPDPDAIARLVANGFFDCAVPNLPRQTWKNAVVTRSLDLPRTGKFWTDPRVQPVFFSPSKGDLPGLVTGPTDPASIAAALAKMGVQDLLLECGGDLLSQWLAAGLVDEVYVTVCPIVLGGKGAPTLADGPGFPFASAPRLRLLYAQPVGSELYCRYEVVRA